MQDARASTGFGEERSGRAGARQRPSQRELLIASLPRCPPDERGGIVHRSLQASDPSRLPEGRRVTVLVASGVNEKDLMRCSDA